jgi:hypothetical protein
MFAPLAKLMRLAALSISLVTIASFALFAVNETESASAHQQRVLNGEVPVSEASPEAGRSTPASRAPAATKKSHGVRGVIDDVSEALTSPFSGATSGSSSEWVKRAANLGLALLVYGFGLGYAARFMRVRQ